MTWHAEIWGGGGPNRSKWRGAGSGIVDPGAFADLTGNAEYGPLFAYMYRRFGVPEFGSDDHKEIANWYITTPDENVVLRVSPRPSGCRYSFGYMINTAVYKDYRTHLADDSKTRATIEIAIKAAMVDLCTPVFVRDVPINGAGRLPDDVEIEEECSPFKWVGYGVDHTYFDKEFGEKKEGETKCPNKP